MPASLAVSPGDIFQFRLLGQLNNQRTISQFSYRVKATVGVLNANAVADAINAAMIIAGGVAFEMLPVLPSNWTGALTECQRTYDKRDRSVIRSAVYAPNGTGGTASTSNVAQVITRRTDNAGRSQVSDLHIPVSTSVASILNGYLTAGQIALLNTYRTFLYSEYVLLAGAITITPVIWHTTKPIPGESYDVITSTVVQQTVRVMRRRTVGLGV